MSSTGYRTSAGDDPPVLVYRGGRMGPRKWIVAGVIVLVVLVGGTLLVIGLTTSDDAEGSTPATPTAPSVAHPSPAGLPLTA
ncbi:MAG TPA: hypothetical protein VGE77_04975 [Nocardioides sp.]